MSNRQAIKRLIQFILQQRLLLLLAFLSAVISVILTLSAPIIIGDTIDLITQTHRFSDALYALTLLAALYIGYSLFHWLMMYTSNRIAFTSSYLLRKQLHDTFDTLPIAFFDSHDRGDLISHYINDIDTISDGLLQGLSTMISGIVTIVCALVFMLQISWQMSIVVILSAPFTYVVARTITTRSQKHFRRQAATLGELNGYSEEMLAQMKTLKAYHYEEVALHTFEDINETLYDAGVKSQFYGSLANPSTRFVMNIAYSLVGIAGAILSLYQIITIGNISTFLMYSNIFSKPFNEITGVITQLQSALASSQRIFHLLDMKAEEDHPDQNAITYKGDITFSHVAFAYTPAKPLMHDVNVHIQAGQKIAIVGTTGAGKTTLVNLLMRFYDIDQGQILLDGVDIQSLSRDTLRKQFGMVLQDTYLFEGSIASNIAYARMDARRDDIIAAAKKSGAHEFIRRLDDGYDTILHGNSSSLSQGQLQLLSITRVILMDPRILILDEATSNMDTRSEQHVSRAMDILMHGKTSFIIAHRLSTILKADQILVMEQGDIIEQGTHEQLLKQQGAYATLYNAQFT